MSKTKYASTLRLLQIELVKLQRYFIACNDKILLLIEGRDAAGKDGLIKRIAEHLSPRETRVVALGKPSDREHTEWYFQRYVSHLPAAQELVLFNRSWYNRAGVERVMGFCSDDEYEEFVQSVGNFELMLMRSGVKLLKYYLDIGRAEQEKRLQERKENPLTQWKTSPIDAQALKKWKAYSSARDQMLALTHTDASPWTIVRADDKRAARLNVIRDMLSRLHYGGKDKKLARPDPAVVFRYAPALAKRGLIAS
jgi:polyphosphate kinase 2